MIWRQDLWQSALRAHRGWRWLGAGLLLVGLALAWYWSGRVEAKGHSGGALAWVFEHEAPASAAPELADEPEAYLKRIEQLIGAQDHEAALQVSSALTRRYPHFQLGQWLHGEILSVTSPVPVAWSPQEAGDRLRTRQDLLKELGLRLQAWRQPHVDGTVPLGLGHVDPSTPHVAVVDAANARFYLFKNESTANTLRLTLVFDTYVTVGLNGLNKKVEGDKRSPVGVYFTQQLLPGKRLPDLYGTGALTLDYPNAWDSAQGRTGSGIWIHGTPSAQYSRAPEASDGCIVVSNDAMLRLLALSPTRGIPVLIQEQVRWVPATQAQASGRALLTALAQSPASAAVPVRWPGHEGDHLGARMVHLFTWTDEGREIAMTEVQRGRRQPVRHFWIKQGGKDWVRFNGWNADHPSL